MADGSPHAGNPEQRPPDPPSHGYQPQAHEYESAAWSPPAPPTDPPTYRTGLYGQNRTNTAPWAAPSWPAGYPGEPAPPGPGGNAPAVTTAKPRHRGRMVAVGTAVVLAAVGGGIAGAAIEGQATNTTTKVVSALAGTPAGNNTDNKNSSTTPTKAPAGSVQQVAAKVMPSVVSITVATSGGGDEGTGVILTSDGEILTNNHVVEAAANGGGTLSVTLSTGRTVKASILGRDRVTDLAVVKAARVSGLTPATLGSSADVAVGQPVVAIGSPLGLSGSVTSGIISALNRPVQTSSPGQGGQGDPYGGGQGRSAPASQATVIDAIQTDAAINPGNSGGPLVDLQGRVIGINSAIAPLGDSSSSSQSGSIGLGFAIPIDEARPVVAQLAAGTKATHARLGVSASDSASATGVGTGAQVRSVTSGGAAAGAGLRTGDVITKVDGRQIDTSDALVAAVRAHRPGEAVTVTYTRDGSSHTATVRLGSD
ncbi:MAG: S1C family serine protease [Mycobacteriales bacterium]